jgi:hypothetical protein
VRKDDLARQLHPFGDEDRRFLDASLTVQLAANSIAHETKRADPRVARRVSRGNQQAPSGAFADTWP